MKRIVIIGANDFQRPLIKKAKEMGYETHVFAWREGATGAADADRFYEISITEKEKILKICRDLSPEGVATIGSDLANITVQYLAQRLGLTANSEECIKNSTNKYLMRQAFQKAGIPVPFFRTVSPGETVIPPSFPVIVKPTDRSGSRAITRAGDQKELEEAVIRAAGESFEKKAIVEAYLDGAEYSVETISWKGTHTCLAITKKYTTGSPHYIEVGHLQPAPVPQALGEKIEAAVKAALTALDVQYGAGHTELRVDEEENIHIIEVGSRMGGDCIGSDLVPLSCGLDYVGMVVDVACGRAPKITERSSRTAAVRFLMSKRDLRHLDHLRREHPENIKKEAVPEEFAWEKIVDSGSRPGFYILQADSFEEMEKLLHEGPEENPVQIFDTPIQPLRISAEDNWIYMKRDDLLPLSFGGNKVRFARYFLEDMRRKHCDSMIIYGNYHSNLCRIMAAVCKELAIPCYMVHNTEDVKETEESFNSSLIRAMGVKEIRCGKKDIARAVRRAMDILTEQGFAPYYIYGDIYGKGNEQVPMEAYVDAYREVCRYEKKTGIRFDYIFLASSTNATQSGLLLGSLLEGDGRNIVGISVSRNEKRGREVLKDNIECCSGKFRRVLPEGWEEQIRFTDAYLEGGYGAYSENIRRVIRSVYQSDGIPLDMTYTGKAFYGMLRYLRENNIRGKNILFWHTGGTPLFFDLLEKERKGK